MSNPFRLHYLALSAVAALSPSAFAQTGPAPTQGSGPSSQTPVPDGFPIATDRPSFSDNSSLVPMGRYQIETGGTYFRVGRSDFGQGPEFLLRVPLTDRFEIRLVNVNYTVFEGGHGSAFQDPGVGFKYRLSRADRRPTGEPEVTFVGLLQVPVGGGSLRADTVQPTAKIAAYLPLTATDGIGGNVLVSFYAPNDARFTQYAASLYEAHTFSSRLASFVEVYGLTPLGPNGGKGAFADAGFTYLLNKRTQIDIRYGSGLNQGRDGQFAGAGIAYRF